jgi:K+-sensing histidine kinase KdpD
MNTLGALPAGLYGCGPDVPARQSARGKAIRHPHPMKSFATSVLKHRARIMPVILPLAMVGATTALLMAIDIYVDTELLVFGYLVPTTLAAVAYGSLAGTFSAIVSALCAAYFLYPPTFALWIDNRLHVVELIIFAALALAASYIVGCMSAWRRD